MPKKLNMLGLISKLDRNDMFWIAGALAIIRKKNWKPLWVNVPPQQVAFYDVYEVHDYLVNQWAPPTPNREVKKTIKKLEDHINAHK